MMGAQWKSPFRRDRRRGSMAKSVQNGKTTGLDGEVRSEGKDNGKHGCFSSMLNKARL